MTLKHLATIAPGNRLTMHDNDELASLTDSQLANLTELRIFGNDSLTSLPDSIGNLTNLTQLWIVNNGSLTSIPASICTRQNAIAELSIPKYNQLPTTTTTTPPTTTP